ncbi:STAS domain-containing protein [Nonomuraea sp. NPDC050643]|uniref:STAS domain-containing protein n=1 Tax=Nonomuraea sp. NPDC050643 TaxID=3155660 RepID=UPI0033E4F110
MTVLTVDIRFDHARAIVQLTGALDITSTEVLHEAIEAVLVGRPNAIEIDMADLRFCDSCGLRVLLQAQRRTGSAGAALHLSHVAWPVAAGPHHHPAG